MKTAKRIIIALIVLLSFSSCEKYNYTDQLQGLGSRVEILEQQLFDINKDITALHYLIVAIEERGFITEVIHNDDGTYTLTLNDGNTVTLRDGKQGQDGLDGRDGKEMDYTVSAAKAADGVWYWTVNGQWLLDSNGDKVRASGTDGKNGENGKDGKNGKDGENGKDGKDGKDGENGQDGQNNPLAPAVVPQVRINEITRHWEISTDGGKTWQDMGVYADGKDGKDGKDGLDGKDGKDGKDGQDAKNGTDDIFADVIVASDNSSITFVLRDGKTFTVPIIID